MYNKATQQLKTPNELGCTYHSLTSTFPLRRWSQSNNSTTTYPILSTTIIPPLVLAVYGVLVTPVSPIASANTIVVDAITNLRRIVQNWRTLSLVQGDKGKLRKDRKEETRLLNLMIDFLRSHDDARAKMIAFVQRNKESSNINTIKQVLLCIRLIWENVHQQHNARKLQCWNMMRVRISEHEHIQYVISPATSDMTRTLTYLRDNKENEIMINRLMSGVGKPIQLWSGIKKGDDKEGNNKEYKPSVYIKRPRIYEYNEQAEYVTLLEQWESAKSVYSEGKNGQLIDILIDIQNWKKFSRLPCRQWRNWLFLNHKDILQKDFAQVLTIAGIHINGNFSSIGITPEEVATIVTQYRRYKQLLQEKRQRNKVKYAADKQQQQATRKRKNGGAAAAKQLLQANRKRIKVKAAAAKQQQANRQRIKVNAAAAKQQQANRQRKNGGAAASASAAPAAPNKKKRKRLPGVFLSASFVRLRL